MTDKSLTFVRQSQPDPLHQQWDSRLVTRFSQKSVSEETRRVYKRVMKEFFSFLGGRHPLEVSTDDVLAWREDLRRKKRKAATISLKLAVVRSFYEYLRAAGMVTINPASTKLVSVPEVSTEGAGRALSPKEVYSLLAGPDRGTVEGARDYALMLLMLRTSLRVSEVCSLKATSMRWSHGRWVLRVMVKGGRERTLPLPGDVKKAIEEYVRKDEHRRELLHSGGDEAYLFQPKTNYRTLVFDKALSTRMVWNIVTRWAEYGGLGRVSPHDLRRTAITRALDQGLSYRQVQMMSGHKDPKTVMRYDHGRENIDLNAVNYLTYEEQE